MSLLSINKLTKTFEGKKAVNQVSFSIEKGEIVGILGESGSGKTTLLHLVAALYEPDSGELLLENRRIIPPSEKLIAGHESIKLVKQDYGLFPNMTIRENIAYELRYYEEMYRKKRIDKLLKISGLGAIQSHLPRQISGGEQQRAVILKAIAEQPKLLLLDEPFSHLDSRNKRILKDEILNIIKSEQIGCIFVTHEVSDAFSIADKLIVMQKGKFLQVGKPKEVYQNPKNEYIAELTGALACDSKNFKKLKFEFKLPEKTKFIRPEQIKLNEKSTKIAEIISSKFCGFHHENTLIFNDLRLKMFCFEPFEISQKIGIEIELF